MPRANRHHWLLAINWGELINYCDIWDAKITKFTYLAIFLFKKSKICLKSRQIDQNITIRRMPQYVYAK